MKEFNEFEGVEIPVSNIRLRNFKSSDTYKMVYQFVADEIAGDEHKTLSMAWESFLEAARCHVEDKFNVEWNSKEL